MKKAQSISINTIVVAAIALIVLVVIIAIFSGRIKIFTWGARDCGTQGGKCDDDCGTFLATGDPDGTIYVNVPGTSCEDDKSTPLKNQCCVPIIKPDERS